MAPSGTDNSVMTRKAVLSRTLKDRTRSISGTSAAPGFQSGFPGVGGRAGTTAKPAAPDSAFSGDGGRGRATAAQRGYGRRWRNYSVQFRRENPLCARCLPEGVITPAECVDHIKPVTGPDDDNFWNPANHQSLCWSCHSIKTQTEDRGSGRVEGRHLS